MLTDLDERLPEYDWVGMRAVMVMKENTVRCFPQEHLGASEHTPDMAI